MKIIDFFRGKKHRQNRQAVELLAAPVRVAAPGLLAPAMPAQPAKPAPNRTTQIVVSEGGSITVMRLPLKARDPAGPSKQDLYLAGLLNSRLAEIATPEPELPDLAEPEPAVTTATTFSTNGSEDVDVLGGNN